MLSTHSRSVIIIIVRRHSAYEPDSASGTNDSLFRYKRFPPPVQTPLKPGTLTKILICKIQNHDTRLYARNQTKPSDPHRPPTCKTKLPEPLSSIYISRAQRTRRHRRRRNRVRVPARDSSGRHGAGCKEKSLISSLYLFGGQDAGRINGGFGRNNCSFDIARAQCRNAECGI